jgi:thioredoxin 1
MKKLLVPVVVLCIVAAVVIFAVMPSTPAASNKIREDIALAKNQGKTVFLQLSSSGCVTCRKMKPEVEKFISENSGSSSLYAIIIDVDSHPSIASEYSVSGVPTQVVLAPSGKELFRNMGYMSYDNIKNVMTRSAE